MDVIYVECQGYGMWDESVKIDMQLREVDLLRAIIDERRKQWEGALEKINRGECSLIELIDCDDEVDAEYQIEVIRRIGRRLRELQNQFHINEVEFIDETTVYRPEQSVETWRVRGSAIDCTVYVLVSRHGTYFLYSSLEGLIDSFLNGVDSKLSFGCRMELESYLNYWRGV